MTAIASGTFRKNTARHETCSTSQPPNTGPNAVVIAEKPDQVPIALPRSSSSKQELINARLPGTSSGADSLHCARGDQFFDVCGNATRSGRERKDDHADVEDEFASVAIAKRTTAEQRRAQKG